MGKHLLTVAACAIVALVVTATACTPAASPGSTTSTSTTVAPTMIVVPTTTVGDPTESPALADETAAFTAMLNSAAPRSTVVVDRPWRIDTTVVVPKPLTLRFEGDGRLVRTVDYVRQARPVLRLRAEASGSRFENLAVQGPVTCSMNWYPWLDTKVAEWAAERESQHGVETRGATDVTFVSPRISGMSGDGLWIAEGSARIDVTDAQVTCVRRNGISNTGSSDVTVTGGLFAGIGRWALNVEPYGSWEVHRYRVTNPTIGVTAWQWFMSEGPGDAFNCKVYDVTVTGADLRGEVTGSRTPAIAPCVAGNITITGTIE